MWKWALHNYVYTSYAPIAGIYMYIQYQVQANTVKN